jgi:hypothetical protein
MIRLRGFDEFTEYERGFRGWLVFFFATITLGILYRGYTLVRFVEAAVPVVTLVHPPEVVVWVTVEVVIRTGVLLACLYGMVLFATGDARTPTYFAIYFLASVAADISLYAIVAHDSTVGTHTSFADSFEGLLRANALALAVMLVWCLYWMRSSRVRLTYGSNAFATNADGDEAVQLISRIT